MSWRRVGFAFAVTFVCALVVFTLPRFVFNTLQGAQVPAVAQDTVAAPAAIQAPSRGIGTRLTGIFGLLISFPPDLCHFSSQPRKKCSKSSGITR